MHTYGNVARRSRSRDRREPLNIVPRLQVRADVRNAHRYGDYRGGCSRAVQVLPAATGVHERALASATDEDVFRVSALEMEVKMLREMLGDDARGSGCMA
jgi:hypothetical protein